MASTSSTIAAVFMAALLVATTTRTAEGQAECASQLLPCAEYLNSTNPPASCCIALRIVVTTELDCVCRLYHTPALFPGVNITQALMLPKYCDISSDVGACDGMSYNLYLTSITLRCQNVP
ncbi:hypothetical protein Salat_0672100 [Sesamum alatum]|uniref:Bifunctional inhibitor/plant lipid transfer protein/seed storage helical domain-containing protein n=1 Tax=Sesamum alatum TaxID=300844 RepID=A0AAE1YSY4_9LAMI|nr:hypothetical protein Salat_0672100 [Sesamum alatum]